MRQIPSILFLFLTLCASAQEKKIEELKQLRLETLKARTDGERELYNNQFDSLMNNILLREDAFTLTFDSIPKIGILYSSDEQLKIITWNLPLEDENAFEYFGYIIRKKKKKVNEVFRLSDGSAALTNAEKKELHYQSWYGALYFDVFKLSKKKDAPYILLGWDGNTPYSTKKVVEVLWFNEDGQPRFGKPIFYGLDEEKYPVPPHRYFMEYSSEITASLQYREAEKRILFDNLAPIQENLEGMYEFYGPDFTYNAFTIEKDKLVFQKNVEYLGPKTNKPYNDPRD